MTDESFPKFELPKTRRDLSNLDELLSGVIAPSEPPKSGNETPTGTQNGLSNAASTAPQTADQNDTPVRQARPKSEKSASRSMLKLIINDDVILATKVRAVERKTTAAAIVEAALRAYLKL